MTTDSHYMAKARVVFAVYIGQQTSKLGIAMDVPLDLTLVAVAQNVAA